MAARSSTRRGGQPPGVAKSLGSNKSSPVKKGLGAGKGKPKVDYPKQNPSSTLHDILSELN